MSESAAYGSGLGSRFRLPRAPAFVTRGLSAGDIAVTEIRCDAANNGPTNPIPREDALLLSVQLRDCPRHELWTDGRPRKTGPLPSGVTCIYDLRTSPIANSIDPFHTLHFYLPAAVLDGVAEEEGWGPAYGFAHEPGLGVIDPVARGLAFSLLPAFERSRGVESLFVDHVVTAMAGHVARLGRRLPGLSQPLRGLSAEQERRAKELLASSSASKVTMADLARACGMPVTVFRRKFLRSTGLLPHAWLKRYRRETARGTDQR